MNVLKRYIWWTEDRGSFHYDVMVTVILLFLFVSPRFINFKAKPVPDVPVPANSVVVKAEGGARFLYEIPVERLHGAVSEAEMKRAVQDVVQPMAGPVTVESYNSVADGAGRVMAYDALVRRENP